MNETLQLIVTVVGGLALFVYGMGLMSEGLTQIAGARLKTALGYVTKNRVAAIAAGAGVTALIQSSSATTVMTVGFVNAGLLSLTQAIGVIFGANIGTTITGQLVSLKLSDLAMPAIILGVVGLMIAHRSTARGAWRTVLGFGLLFFGMNLMSNELKGISKLPEFIAFFSKFDCTPTASGYLPMGSVLGGIAVGTICTMLVQSSSATIGIAIALANAGIINVWTAIPIVLGDNIGTTITAALAAIGTNANAKRTALAHALFNLIGTILLVSSFVFVFANAQGVRAPAFYHLVNFCTEGNGLLGENPGRHVAMAHTLFNVTNVLVLAFFIPLLARFCTFVIRDKNTEQGSILEPRFLYSPELALAAAQKALGDMTRRAWTLAGAAIRTYQGKASVSEEQVEDVEREIDRMQHDIRDYLTQITRQKLTERQSDLVPDLFHCVNDAERVSDLAVRIYKKAQGRKDAQPSPVLQEITAKCRQLAHKTFAALDTGLVDTEELAHIRRDIRALADAATEDPKNVIDIPVLTSVYDIARHLTNIAKRVQ